MRIIALFYPVVALAAGITLLVWSMSAQAAKSATPATGDTVSAQLKAAVIASTSKLGELEPWQKRIFNEEVVPQYQRFVRDYRSSSGEGVKAEIDVESLRHYLRFYAPNQFKPEKSDKADAAPKALLVVRTDPACAKCVAATVGVKGLLKARTERRGFAPTWLSPEELTQLSHVDGDSEITGKLLEGKLAQLALAKGYQAVGVVQWNPAQDEDIDSAHADEKRYVMRSFFQVKDLGVTSESLELIENDSFEPSVARLLTDAFTDFGRKAEAFTPAVAGAAGPSGTGAAGAEAEGPVLEVTGVPSYAWYQRLKAQLAEKLRDAAVVEVQKLSRGQVAFAVRMRGGTPDEIRKRLAGFSVRDGDGGAPMTVSWELR